jgi:hypothetical protein
MHEKELILDENVTLLILLYGNFLQQIKKGKWNGIVLGELGSQDGILNVVQCLENIWENILISIIEGWI